MITYKNFTLRAIARPGIRLKESPLVETKKFDLANNFCIHYLSDAPSLLGMRGSNPLIRTWVKKGSVSHFSVTQPTELLHKARNTVVSKTAINEYYNNQDVFSKALKLERVVNRERSLLVIDYTMMGRSLVIKNGMMQYYHYFTNVLNEINRYVNDVTASRINLIELKLPDTIPERSFFEKADGELSKEEAIKWPSYELLWLRELYLLAQGKGLLVDMAKKQLFVSFPLLGNIVTLDCSRIYAESEEKGDVNKKDLYTLFDQLLEYMSATESESLEGVENAKPEEYKDVSDSFYQMTEQRVKSGEMTLNEQAKFITSYKKSQELTLPDGTKLVDFAKTKPEDYVIDKETNVNINDNILTKEESVSTMDNFNKSYVDKVMSKHIAAVASAFNDAGYILEGFDISDHIDIGNDYMNVRFTINPVNGKKGTFDLKIPTVDETGKFIMDNVKYTADISRVDSPIRKVNEYKAALSSYYGKMFVVREETAKYNWTRWLVSNIQKASMSSADKSVTNVERDNLKVPDVKAPRAYTALCTDFKSFTSGNYRFNFDYHSIEETFGKNAKTRINNGLFPVGFTTDNKGNEVIVYMDMNNELHVNAENVGRFVDVLKIKTREPNDIAIMRVHGKKVSMGIVLGYYLGIDELIRQTKAEVLTFPANTRDRKDPKYWIELVFSDKRVFVKKDNPIASMVFASFDMLKDSLLAYKFSDLNDQANYNAMILDMGMSARVTKEIDLVSRLFIDPITRDVLLDMGEPTTWVPLLFRALELIATDESTEETDPHEQRLRGFEKIPGKMYNVVASAIKSHENAYDSSNQALSIDSLSIWKALQQDTSIQLAQHINPIHTLKEVEAISLSGDGGRSARSLVLRSRKFNDKDVGIISEATPDSAKVAIRTYATPNAKINSTLGMMGSYDPETDNTTSLISTTSLVLPAATHEDQQLGPQ